MTNQEIINAIRQSGKLETYVKEVKREVLPQCSTSEILEALEWGVEQGQVIPAWKSPIGNYVVKSIESVAEVAAPAVVESSLPVAQVKTVEEDEDEEDEAEALFGEADVEWTASNGQRIRVWAGNFQGQFHVAVDSKLWTGKSFQPVPAKFAAQAQKNGVIAMLGPVGLNAERKLACQRIPRHGVNQPVG